MTLSRRDLLRFRLLGDGGDDAVDPIRTRIGAVVPQDATPTDAPVGPGCAAELGPYGIAYVETPPPRGSRA